MANFLNRWWGAIGTKKPPRPAGPDLVDTLYQMLLHRAPDESGRTHFNTALAEGRASAGDIVEALLKSEEFFEKRGAFAERYYPARQNAFFAEVSQFGETSQLMRAMMDMACTNKVLVDVGVMGRTGSNSYDLLRWFGWRGLLIEANSGLIGKIAEEFGDLNYSIVNVAVSDHSGSTTLHIGSSDGVSSLTEDHARMFGPTKGVITVQMETLPAILERENIPLQFDLLSIDIEGEDVKVLNHMLSTSPYRPNWIIFEAGHIDAYRPGMLSLIAQFDSEYELVGKTQANLIFRNRSLRAILRERSVTQE